MTAPQGGAGGRTSSPHGYTETEIELRRTLVFRLRSERRMSYRQIAAALASGTVGPDGKEVKFTISPKQVRNDYWHVMRESGYTPDPDAVENYRAEQLEQCEQIKAGLRATAFAGDDKAANAYLRTLDHEAKLLGLYVPIPERAPERSPEELANEVAAFLAGVAAVQERSPGPSSNGSQPG